LAPDDLLTFKDPSGNTVRVYTRSVLGVYRHLGLYLLGEQPVADPSPGRYLTITHDTTNCWSRISYEGQDWCVPNSARGTKVTFAVLRQMLQLYTSSKDVQTTPSVRVVQ
jgi:hypothetical protein